MNVAGVPTYLGMKAVVLVVFHRVLRASRIALARRLPVDGLETACPAANPVGHKHHLSVVADRKNDVDLLVPGLASDRRLKAIVARRFNRQLQLRVAIGRLQPAGGQVPVAGHFVSGNIHTGQQVDRLPDGLSSWWLSSRDWILAGASGDATSRIRHG